VTEGAGKVNKNLGVRCCLASIFQVYGK